MNKQIRDRSITFAVILLMMFGTLWIPASNAKAAEITFTAEELLGKPTDHSITINIVPASTIEYHYQYGTASGSYDAQTENVTATGGQPSEITITGLDENTQYFYRMQYHVPGDDWVNRSEHSFWTQRDEGVTFTFAVTTDAHAMLTAANFQNTMTNIYNEHPDFLVDLGDTFMVDNTTTQTAVNNKYLAFRDPVYWDKIGSSTPIFLSSGNHEEEEGWNLNDTPFSIGVASIQARKLYYPTPITDGFYTGNDDPLAAIDAATYGDQLREDYYAWTWGDALFVVIDPFQYTMNLPYAPGSAGEGTNDVQDGDQWSWTLGEQQFNWLKQTLQNSNAKYKFVFSHQMVGGIPNLTVAGVGPGYVRGGAGAAPYFEWGGKNADGSEGFATHRSEADFGTMPIHQMFVEYGVSAYFHGHDHQYVYEILDGVVYQEVPSPSMTGSGFSGIYSESDSFTIEMLPNAGHLLLTITPEVATVDYINSGTGVSNYQYSIEPNATEPTHELTVAVSPEGTGTTSPAAGVHTYDEGESVEITATPAIGYLFDHWDGDCSGTTNPCNVTMNADMDVTAYFTINTEGKLGDINWDNEVDSTDALIILSGDVGTDITQFCPANCGDVNADGLVNSTDALIILSYDVGMTVPFALGQAGMCPVDVTPCPGCNP